MTSDPNYPGHPEGLGPMPGDTSLPQTGPAPRDVETSVKLWFASIVVGVLGGILGIVLADRDGLRQSALDSNSSLTPDQLDAAVTVGLVIGLVFALIILALEVFFVFKMRAGRNWARIVLTVLGVLGVLSTLYGFTSGFGIGSILNLISLALMVAAVVFMFRPAANAYFTGGRRP